VPSEWALDGIGKNLEKGYQDIVVQLAEEIIELDGAFGKAVHVNLNIPELVKQLATLIRGVTADDGGIFLGMLDRCSRQDRH
jgi:hypothetical protein